MPKLYQPPPSTDQFMEVNDPKIGLPNSTNAPKLSWLLFFEGLFTGDTGEKFTPAPVNLTAVGTPTYTGFYFVSGQFIDFEIHIIPGTSTTSVQGTTYIPLPFTVKSDGPCFAVSGLAADIGAVEAATNRCYPPSWSAVTVPLTISGRLRAA